MILNENIYELENLIREKSKFSKSTVNKLFTYLTYAVLDYYRIKCVIKDEIYLQLRLNDYLLNIEEYKLLDASQIKLDENILNSNTIMEDSFLYSHLQNNNLYATSISNNNLWKNKENDSLTYIKNSTNDIYLFSLIQSIYNYVNFIIKKININRDDLNWNSVNLDSYLIAGEEIIYYDKNMNRQIVFNLYKKLYLAFKNLYIDDFYQDYKSFFFEYIKTFNIDTVIKHFELLTGYCLARERSNDNNNYFSYEWLNLTNQKMNLENSDNTSNKYLRAFQFRNYIIKCFALYDHVHLLNFIEKYSIRLSPIDYKEMLNYGMAHYYYLIYDYKKALKCLNNIKINYYFYKYDLTNLELKIYFDKYNIDLIERAIHNYNELLKHDTFLTKLDKIRLKKLLSYYQKLIYLPEKLKLDNKYLDDVYILKSQLGVESNFAMRKWLIQKVDELIFKFDKDTVNKEIKNK
jgi:hypothetical protein